MFKKIKNSFKKVKADVDEVRRSLHEWVLYLNGNQNDLKIQLRELDRRVRQLESEQEIRIYK